MTGFSAAALAANQCPPNDPSCVPSPWVTYCQPLVADGVPCTEATFDEGIRYGTPGTITQPAVPAYTAAGWGNSHAAVATNFGAVQLANFQSSARRSGATTECRQPSKDARCIWPDDGRLHR
jgi:hypothetical protein